MADNLTPEQRSRTMSRIRSKDTKAEMLLRKVLHRKGLRYRVHISYLPGKPDIVFTKRKVVVFVDGDFWHGWKFTEWCEKLQPYWRKKIEGNQARDRQTDIRLMELGWTVLRIWEHEVKSDPELCAARVERLVRG
jgi:DNA mismatch endonuclease, patch repair protein